MLQEKEKQKMYEICEVWNVYKKFNVWNVDMCINNKRLKNDKGEKKQPYSGTCIELLNWNTIYL